MNKKLFENVKGKCKDTGLSEKYLNTITDKMGGSIADDSTDETAIEAMANQIADIAKESQGEATRWVNAKKDPKDPKEPKEQKDPDPKDPIKEPEEKDPYAERMAALEKELKDMKDQKANGERSATIKEAIKKHGIPEWRTKGLVVPDDADPDTFIADIKQDLITNNLMPQSTEGAKAATDAGTNEAAESLLKSITVK